MILNVKVWLFLLPLALVGGIFGANVTPETQVDLLNKLQTTAAFIFTVAGAWVAVVYTEILRALMSDDATLTSRQQRLLGGLRFMLVASTLVLIVSLGFEVSADLVPMREFLPKGSKLPDRLGMAALLPAYALQLFCLAYALYPMVVFDRELHDRSEDNRLRNQNTNPPAGPSEARPT